MAYPITNNIIPGLPKQSFRNGAGAYEGVVAHATAVYAPAANQVRYFQANWQQRQAFVQFFVDWTGIYQTADINYRGWGAGPTANKRYVHVELCQTKDHAQFLESYKRYVWLLAWLQRRRTLGVTDGKTLVSHNWCSVTFGDTTHTDPIGYLKEHGVTWAKLVADVKAEYSMIDANGNYKVATVSPQPANQIVDMVKIEVKGKPLSVTGILQNGVSLLPIRAVAESVGGNVAYNATNKQITVNGKDLSEHIIDGTGYAPARELASILGLSIEWDEHNKTVKMGGE